ncbi:MAG: iron transporter [Streptosporangiales bacterium]|nr:iron transporter [Streptosporangiales bacterium]
MFGNFLIGLREGLEAALIVSILVAYLVKTGHRDRLRAVAIGVGAAVVLALGFAGALTLTATQLSEEAEEAFGGVLSLVAVALVTWMIFWMRRTSHLLKAELEGQVERALSIGALAVAAVAFVAVAREGLETALFLWTNITRSGETAVPLLGATLGLLTAIVLAYLLYNRAVRVNLKSFFTWTGGFLIVIAAGVFAYGWHELQEAGLIPGEDAKAYDLTGIIDPERWYGTLLEGTINFDPDPSILQVVVWLAYIVPTAVLFFRPRRAVRQDAPAAAPHTETAKRG